MFLFKGYIFNEFFTAFDKRTDPNKDSEGRGTQERFQEIFEDELDEGFTPLIENMQTNLYDPQKCLDRFIPYLEAMFGYEDRLNDLGANGDFSNDFSDDFLIFGDSTWVVTDSLQFRRNVLDVLLRLYSIKGTERLYRILFSWLGMEFTLVELPLLGGSFDIPGLTFDMEGRTFDMDCPGCTDYELHLTGSYEGLTAFQVAAIQKIIKFNSPINARLVLLTYNTVSI